MSKVTVAFGSFVLGAVFVLAFGNHASTLRQSAFAQLTPPGVPAGGNRWTPIVPGLSGGLSTGNINAGENVNFDGLTSRGDTFANANIVYGGGAYSVEHATLSGHQRISLIGAAANTAIFLHTFGLLGCPAAKPTVPQVNPNTPMVKTADFKTQISGDLSSPYKGK